jgi:glycerol kinase
VSGWSCSRPTGAVVNRWLMQFQADVLGAPVSVPAIAETTALGAAYLAGIATALWDRQQVEELWREGRPLRAADVRRRAPGAAGRLAPRARPGQGLGGE